MRHTICVLAVILAVTAGVADDVDGGFVSGGVYRTYTLYIPPSYDGTDSVPLVFNLHGGNGNAAGQATLSGMNAKADAEGFLVAYPNGTMLPAGYTGWNAGEWAETSIDDIGFISELMDTIISNYNIDTLRIYATGFSLGAMMCHTLACELSTRFAAVAPVEGGLTTDDWSSCEPSRLISIMHFHHRLDATVPYYGDPEKAWAPPIDSVMEFWAEELGCDAVPDTFHNDEGAFKQTWSRDDDSCEVAFWTLEQGNGHSWPGVGAGSQELSANDEMWDFFIAHPIPVEEDTPVVVQERPQTSSEITIKGGTVHSSAVEIVLGPNCPEHINLAVFDRQGRRVYESLVLNQDNGERSIFFDTSNLSSGVYFYTITSLSFLRRGAFVILH